MPLWNISTTVESYPINQDDITFGQYSIYPLLPLLSRTAVFVFLIPGANWNAYYFVDLTHLSKAIVL